MAFNYSELESTTQEMYLPVIYSQIFESHPLLQKIKNNKETISGGTSIDWTVQYDRLNAQGWGIGTNVDISPKEVFTKASVPIRGIIASVHFDDFEMGMNAGGSTQVHSILEEKMKVLQETMEEKLVENIFGDNNTAVDTEMIGLSAILRDDNSYAGIDRLETVAYDGSFWKSKVFSNGGTPRALTLDLLQDAIMQVTRGKKTKDYMLVVSFDVFNKLNAILMEKYNTVDKFDNMANAGFLNIKYLGIPVIPEVALADNDIRIINTKHLKMKTTKKEDFKMSDFLFAQNTTNRVKHLRVQGNLLYTTPRESGIIKDIDPNL